MVLSLLALQAAVPEFTSASEIFADELADGVSADGNCALREAVISANENRPIGGCPSGEPGLDTVSLMPVVAQSYELDGESGEDAARTGDLDVTEPLRVVGMPRRKPGVLEVLDTFPNSTIGAEPFTDRIFDVHRTSLTIVEVRIEDGHEQTGADGGGIRVTGPNATLRLRHANVDINASSARGGSIAAVQGFIDIRGSTLTGGNARAGGGIFAQDSELRIVDSYLQTNGYGLAHGRNVYARETPVAGGLLTMGGGSTRIENTSFVNNYADQEGGAIVHRGSGPLDIVSSTFTGNTAQWRAGAIDSEGGQSVSRTSSSRATQRGLTPIARERSSRSTTTSSAAVTGARSPGRWSTRRSSGQETVPGSQTVRPGSARGPRSSFPASPRATGQWIPGCPQAIPTARGAQMAVACRARSDRRVTSGLMSWSCAGVFLRSPWAPRETTI